MSPYTIALGGLDYIVQRRKMLRKINEWRPDNPLIHIIEHPRLGHTGTIKWFNSNILSLLEPLNDEHEDHINIEETVA